MANELCVLLELLRPELPFWTSFISGYLSAADLYGIFCSCKTLSASTEDENFWRLRWQSFRPKLKATRPPLGLQSWKAAHQHLALFRSPEQIQEVGAAGLEKDLLSDVTCALHAESGLRAYGYSDGSVRVVRPTPGGGPRSAVPQELLSANVTTYTLGSGSIRHMQLSEDGSTLYVGCWAGAVHHIMLGSLDSSTRAFSSARTARGPSTDESEGKDSPPSAPAQSESAAAAEASTHRVVAGMQGPIYALRLDNGVLYTCCGDGTIQAWDSSTGQMVGTLEGHTAGVTDFCAVRLAVTSPASSSVDAACSPESRTHYLPLLISSSYDGTVRVWKSIAHTSAPRRRAHHAPLLTLRGHRGPVWTVAAEGTTIYSGSADGSVRVWSIRAAPEETAAYGQAEPVHMLTGSCLAVLQHTGALVGSDVLAADQLSSSPAPTAQQGGVGGAAVAGAHNRKQIWCLKLFGPLVITGSSDGALSCWDTECLRSQMDAASKQRPLLPVVQVPGVPMGNGIGGGAAAPGAVGTPRVAVPVLLWNIAGPGCDGLSDGVRRMDVVRNTIYTTTKHGNVGVARLSSPLLGLPRAFTAPDVAFESGSGGTQGSSAALQTVSCFRASSEPALCPTPHDDEHSATHSMLSASSPAPGPVTPKGKTASGGVGKSWEGSSSSSSSLSPTPAASILPYPEASHTPVLALAAPADSTVVGYHVATGHVSTGTRSSRAGSDSSRLSGGSGPNAWIGGSLGGGFAWESSIYAQRTEQAGAQPRHTGSPDSSGARGRPLPSPVRVGSGPCSNVRA